jgi:uncharacterized protein
MAYEDSHTFFVVTWLRRCDQEDLLRLWYDYREELFDEKTRHPKRKVYSRLYEFYRVVEEQVQDTDALARAYEETLEELGTIEKLPIEN